MSQWIMVFLFHALSASKGQAASADSASEGQVVSVKSIPLRKQYVPAYVNGKLIAYKTAYFGDVEVGTPDQKFSAVFDTGSGHVILPTRGCLSKACSTHRRYDSAVSSSATNIKFDGSRLTGRETSRDQVVVSFGTGKVTGEFVEDKICIGNSTEQCSSMHIVLAVEMTDDPFSEFAFDGIVGLGLDKIRLGPKFSFFGEMVAQHLGMLPQFSYFISRHEDGASTITFGGFDKQRAASEIQWTPVAMPEHGHWLVQIKQIRIGDTVLEECAEGDCHAVADTGTSLLGVPRMAVRSMHRLLARSVPDGEDPDKVDCRNVPGHSIDFDLGDTVVSVPFDDYSRPSAINVTNNETSRIMCRALLLPTDMGPPIGPKLFILGEPVLRRYLTVYDVANLRIGFSLARQSECPDGPPVSVGIPPEGSLLIGAPLPNPACSNSSPEAQSSEDVVL